MNNSIDPKLFENPNKTIYQALLETAELYENYYALGFYGRRITYRELIDNINKVAKALIKAGVKRGDTVTFMLPNCPQAVAVYYAINRIGAVANMVNPLASGEALDFYINKPKSRFVVTLDSFCEKTKHLDENLIVIYIKIIDDMPEQAKIAYLQKNKDVKIPNTSNCLCLNELIQSSVEIELPPINYIPNTTSTILYTGGTTGTPKGACISDKNINSCIPTQFEVLGNPITPGKKSLAIMPLFHSYGIMYSIHLCICVGYQCILLPQFNLDECFKIIIEEKINNLSVIPSIYEAMLKSDVFDGVDLSFLECVTTAGDTASVEFHKRVNSFLAEHNCDLKLRVGYALTETTTLCVAIPNDDIRPGSTGVPFGDTKARIVKPGTFEDLPEGEKGELILWSSGIMLHYLDNPEETAKVLKKDADGLQWLFTGDICYFEDGFIYFVQRMKRLIKSAGNSVYSVEVEKVIDNCDCVRSSCVVGVKNKLLGQAVCACVILNDGYDERQSRIDIINTCKENLTAPEVPTKIVFVDEFPLTKVGKIDYMTLEKIQNERAGL